MASILSYFGIIRPNNLLIIVLSQYFIHYHVILPLATNEPVLNSFHWLLLVLITCIIAASGYIINDIYDKDIDLTNKPHKTYIPNKISITSAYHYYWTLVIIGFFMALFVAIQTNFMSHIWIYPLCIGLLYIYASKLKSTVLWGNILVSLFVAWVWGILFYIQSTQEIEFRLFTQLGFGFGLLGFCVNMMREIVKDIEDIQGDALLNIRTLPIVFGISASKNILYGLGFFVSCMVVFMIIKLNKSFEALMFGVFLLCFIILTIFKIYVSHKKSDYGQVSRFLKIIMLMGIIGIFIISKYLTFL